MLKDNLDTYTIEIEKKSAENEELNNNIDILSDQLCKLTEENLRLSQMVNRKIDFWSCLLRINTAYEYITDTSERLLADINKERPLSDPERWFLKCHGSRSLWKSIMNKTVENLQEYERASSEQKTAYIRNLDAIMSKFASNKFDSYIMSDEEVTELVSNLFFLLRLCERYRFTNQFELLNAKASEYILLCNSLIADSWEAELALCENDY